MIINIHWGEFCGEAERTEVHFPPTANQSGKRNSVYQYYLLLKGYLPFTLLKNYLKRQWITGPAIDSSISNEVIFYTKKFIDDFELKNPF